jgi:sulfotransferase family protein
MIDKSAKEKAPFPNTFLIGVQKAGTTTLNNWLSQHPQIYCYQSLKDIPLFVKFPEEKQLNKRLSLETPAYNHEPVVLHSAVNYIFYPSLLQKLATKKPDAKLIIILRNPVARAISSYFYFEKMLREKRGIEEALIYQPKKSFEITRDNNDFTYIEHGFYYAQLKNCLQYFSNKQLMILDYDDLKANQQQLLKNVFYFLNIDENFMPDLPSKNITGDLKSRFLQERMLKKNKLRKWVVDHLIDAWFPVNKRKMLKNKFFELNTSAHKQPAAASGISEEKMQHIKNRLREFYLHDTALLDELLGTSFYKKWFAHEVISNN